MSYKKHVFLCTNSRVGRECCQNHNASEMADYLKKKLVSNGLTKEKGFKVSKSGCMGYCSKGPALVIYPEGTWYTYHDEKDIDEIIEKSIINNDTVSRLNI